MYVQFVPKGFYFLEGLFWEARGFKSFLYSVQELFDISYSIDSFYSILAIVEEYS